MQELQKLMEEYLSEKGYAHQETVTETYKCKPYHRETARYARPTPDPEGTDEYTRTYTKTVVDELSYEELQKIFGLEQQRELLAIKKELRDLKDEVDWKVDEAWRNTRFLRTYTIVIIVLNVLGFFLSMVT